MTIVYFTEDFLAEPPAFEQIMLLEFPHDIQDSSECAERL